MAPPENDQLRKRSSMAAHSLENGQLKKKSSLAFSEGEKPRNKSPMAKSGNGQISNRSSLSMPENEQLRKKSKAEEERILSGVLSRWPGGGASSRVGMTEEQVIEFKKQQMLTRILQDKVKELDSKLDEANAAIKSCTLKTAELAENESKDATELFEAINNVSTTMHEKLAQQRVEVQKLSRDTPAPINYEPFHYGEAYTGDIIDFQARQRIIEVKETMKTIMSAIKDMRDSMTFTPYNDLGYRVVRLDRLVHEADHLIAERDKGVVVKQQSSGNRGYDNTTRFPKVEMSQAAPSQYGITDAIQQTMYRLEIELAGIRDTVGGMDLNGAYKTIDELKTNMATLKENVVDQKMARKIAKEIVGDAAPRKSMLPLEDRESGNNLQYIRSSSQGQMITPDKFKEAFDSVNRSVNALSKRLKALETKSSSVSHVSESTSQSRMKIYQQKELQPHVLRNSPRPPNGKSEMATVHEHQMAHHSGFGSRLGHPPAYPYTLQPRMRDVMDKGYEINVNSEVVGVYHVARGQLPVVGVSSGWRTREEPLPRITPCTARSAQPPGRHVGMEDQFIRGKDGKLYIADVRQPHSHKHSPDIVHREMPKPVEAQQPHHHHTLSRERVHIHNNASSHERVHIHHQTASREHVHIPTLMTTEATPEPSVIQERVRRHSDVEAATVIQAGMRGMLARKSIKEEKIKIKKDHAAAKIQAGFRGMKTRRESSLVETKSETKLEDVKPEEKVEEEEIDIDLKDPEVEKTALMMQKRFFGKKK